MCEEINTYISQDINFDNLLIDSSNFFLRKKKSKLSLSLQDIWQRHCDDLTTTRQLIEKKKNTEQSTVINNH